MRRCVPPTCRHPWPRCSHRGTCRHPWPRYPDRGICCRGWERCSAARTRRPCQARPRAWARRPAWAHCSGQARPSWPGPGPGHGRTPTRHRRPTAGRRRSGHGQPGCWCAGIHRCAASRRCGPPPTGRHRSPGRCCLLRSPGLRGFRRDPHRRRYRLRCRGRSCRGRRRSCRGQRRARRCPLACPPRPCPSTPATSLPEHNPKSQGPLPVEAAPARYVRRRPTLPRGPPRSTIGAEGLNFRVRNGTGYFPFAMATETLWRCGTRPHLGNRTVDACKTCSSRSQATRPISTGQLHVLPRFHFRPINPVV
jgi:hypothetical protein